MWDLSKVNWGTRASNKKKNAKERGLECRLTKNQIQRIYEKNGGVCDYTGIPLSLEDGHEHQATLERCNEDVGYIPCNVLLVSSTVNTIKAKYLEHKGTDGRYMITKEEKEILNKICETLYNPENMKSLGEKYGWNETQQPKEEITLPQETTTENKTTSGYDYNTTVNSELAVAKLFASFGAFIEQRCGSEFNITFPQFKTLITRKNCMLTKRPLPESLFERGFWIKDKSKPVTKENLFVTTKELKTALDNMCVNANLDIKTIKQLGSVLIK